MRSKLERNQIITSEEKGRLRNHCYRTVFSNHTAPRPGLITPLPYIMWIRSFQLRDLTGRRLRGQRQTMG